MTDTPPWTGRVLTEQEEAQELRDQGWDAEDRFWDRVDRLVDYGGTPGSAVELALLEEKAA